MSITAINLCWQLQKPLISASEKLVLMCLAKHLRDNAVKSGVASQICYPSIGRIEKNTSLSRRQVTRNLQKLEEKNLIRIKKRQGRSSIYHVMLSNIRKCLKTEASGITPTDNTPSHAITLEGVPYKTETSATMSGPDDTVAPVTSTNKFKKDISARIHKSKYSEERSEKEKRAAVREKLRNVSDTDW